MAVMSSTIRSLLVTSLALPGMRELLALDLPDESLDYRYTFYDEDPLPANRLAFGDPRRYEIESHQFRVLKNLNETYSLELDFLHEAMSGSSPWYAVPGPDGPLQVMSGATIRERRKQGTASLGWTGNRYAHKGSIGYSSENDYEARYVVYSGETESEDGLRTISWSGSYSDDEITPTDAEEFGRVEYEERDSLSGSVGLTQVLNRNALVQAGLSVTRQTGFLSDPYKQVWINQAVVNDSRPDERSSIAGSGRFRQYIEKSGAALAIDYRFFRDDWKIASHTVTAALHQPLGDGWECTPSVRYYTQKAPNFYAPYFLAAPKSNHWSSDYRLSSFGALSFRLHTRWRGEKWLLSAGLEYYTSSESLALAGKAQDTPANVDFWRFTAGLSVSL
jgi:hypothetical protein